MLRSAHLLMMGVVFWCHRVWAPGKISSPGASGLWILLPPELLSSYEARKKAPPLGKFLWGAEIPLRSLLLLGNLH